MIIIIEGCDLSGKTTFAQRCVSHFNALLYKGLYFGEDDFAIDDRNSKYLKTKYIIETIVALSKLNTKSIIVCDRFLFSELVYGNILRNMNYDYDHKEIKKLLQLIEQEKNCVVHLTCDEITTKERYASRGDDRVTLENIQKLKAEYEFLFSAKRIVKNVIRFDTSKNSKQTESEILDKITELLR